MSLTPQWLDELRARTTLSTLIGKSVKVTRAGREWKACCPFHNEKTPSFTINDDKGFYHCLAAETRVITRNGHRPIGELAGTRAEVLTSGGAWVPAMFDNYGVQRLERISLSRNGVKKNVYATSGHRWFVRGRKSALTTAELSVGHRLESVLPEKRSDWSIDPQGVRHGIMFGDGTLYLKRYGTLNLHGEKDAELACWFPDHKHHSKLRDENKPYLRIYGGRDFGSYKQFPSSDLHDSYLLGFLAGYIAADGHVAKDGTVILNSATPEHLERVRALATRLAIGTYGITTQIRRGLGDADSAIHRIHFVPSTFSADLLLLSTAKRRFQAHTKAFDRLRWTVTSISTTDRVEEVFCATVPGTHSFALEDNILSGNCFGCGAHGDAIRWMTDQRGLAFMDAVKELAVSAGMEVPAADPRAAKRAEEAVSLRDVTEASAAWFREQLADAEGAEARAYLAKRGLTQQTIATFALGYAPDARGRLREVLAKFGEPLAIEAGMLIQPPDDAQANRREPYDRFRGRLMIPIRDARGRVIAFGGRILGAGEPKYLNSPDTPLFDKGRILYNLDRAAPAARKANRLIVVEGYMDVIALAQAGIEEAVAPLGTALTEDQIALAWRQVPVPILAFDGDAAGQRAALRAATRALPLLKPGHSLAFITLPPGQDPDDIVRSGGAAAFDALLATPAPLVEMLWRTALTERPDDTPESRAGVRARCMEWADTIADRDVQAHYRQAFRERLDDAFFAPRQREQRSGGGRAIQRGGGKGGRNWTPPERAPSLQLRTVGQSIDSQLADAIIAGLLRYPARVERHAEALASLPIPDSRSEALIGAIIEACLTHQGLDSAGLLTILGNTSVYNRAVDLLRADGMHFSFTRPIRKSDEQTDADRAALESVAMRDLDEAIAALVAWPEVERSLAAATLAMQARLDDESYAEQQRWKSMKESLAGRLAELAESGRQS